MFGNDPTPATKHTGLFGAQTVATESKASGSFEQSLFDLSVLTKEIMSLCNKDLLHKDLSAHAVGRSVHQLFLPLNGFNS